MEDKHRLESARKKERHVVFISVATVSEDMVVVMNDRAQYQEDLPQLRSTFQNGSHLAIVGGNRPLRKCIPSFLPFVSRSLADI